MLQKLFLSHHDKIKRIGISFIDYLITPKTSCPYSVLITIEFCNITLYILRMIETPFRYKNSETLHSSFINYI